jgi:hypothetical protein
VQSRLAAVRSGTIIVDVEERVPRNLFCDRSAMRESVIAKIPKDESANGVKAW